MTTAEQPVARPRRVDAPAGADVGDTNAGRTTIPRSHIGDTGGTLMTTIEVRMTLDLGFHAPGSTGLVGQARALALSLKEEAEEVAATAAEASGSEEVHAARPHVEYRAGGSDWFDVDESEP